MLLNEIDRNVRIKDLLLFKSLKRDLTKLIKIIEHFVHGQLRTNYLGLIENKNLLKFALKLFKSYLQLKAYTRRQNELSQ